MFKQLSDLQPKKQNSEDDDLFKDLYQTAQSKIKDGDLDSMKRRRETLKLQDKLPVLPQDLSYSAQKKKQEERGHLVINPFNYCNQEEEKN